jgi:hypothetical protein
VACSEIGHHGQTCARARERAAAGRSAPITVPTSESPNRKPERPHESLVQSSLNSCSWNDGGGKEMNELRSGIGIGIGIGVTEDSQSTDLA